MDARAYGSSLCVALTVVHSALRFIVLIVSCDDAKTIETKERSQLRDNGNARELRIA